jgi:hypothetical protein
MFYEDDVLLLYVGFSSVRTKMPIAGWNPCTGGDSSLFFHSFVGFLAAEITGGFQIMGFQSS